MDNEGNNKKKTSIVTIIVGIFIVVLFGAWTYMLFTDYNGVKKGVEPKFCFFGKKEVKEELGTIVTHTCLGYKVVSYKKEDSSLTEFSPLWQRNKKLEDINK